MMLQGSNNVNINMSVNTVQFIIIQITHRYFFPIPLILPADILLA